MTTSAHRFLSYARVDESEILAGHVQKTQARMNACQGPILMLHDIAEFTRSGVNRLANETTLAEEMIHHHDSFQHAIRVIDGNGDAHEAKLPVKVKSVEIHPAIG